MAKLWSHVQDPCPLPSSKRPELVKAFDDVVARATAKDPDDRFARASDLAAAVDAAMDEQRAYIGPAALQVTRVPTPTRRGARRLRRRAYARGLGAAAEHPGAARPRCQRRPPTPRRPARGTLRPQGRGPSRILLALGLLVGMIVIAVAAVLVLERRRRRRRRIARAGAGGRRHRAPGEPELAAHRRAAVPAPVRGIDGRRRQDLRVRRHRHHGVHHHDQDLRPGVEPLDDRARPATAAAPLHGRDLQGRGRGDRRLRARGRADVEPVP